MTGFWNLALLIRTVLESIILKHSSNERSCWTHCSSKGSLFNFILYRNDRCIL